MIFTERTITVVNDSATINKPLILYRGDKNIELKITIAESQFKFRNTDASNVIETTDASYAQLVINTPYNSPIFSDVAVTKNGAVIFVITEAMIDEIREVGAYEIQIRLLDDNKQSRASIPPVSNAIEIREPIAIEDGSTVDSNAVNVAKVNRALTTTSAPLEAFDSQGNYIKKTWGDGDPITDAALNKMEAAIDGVNKKIGNNRSQIKEMAKKTSVENGKLYLLKSDGTKIDTGTEIPTANVTDEQLTTIINRLIADGTLGALTIEDGSITYAKLSNDVKDKIENSTNSFSSWLAIGDSITVGYNNNNYSYADIIAEKYGIYMVKDAVTGSNIASDQTNFGPGFVNRVDNNVADYNLITVMGGLNDFNHATVTLGTFNPDIAITGSILNFYDGVTILCKKLITKYPNSKIVFLSSNRDNTYNNKNSESYEQFMEAINTVCSYFSIPFYRIDNLCGFNRDVYKNQNIDNGDMNTDDIHPKTLGHRKIAGAICDCINFVNPVDAWGKGTLNITQLSSTIASDATMSEVREELTVKIVYENGIEFTITDYNITGNITEGTTTFTIDYRGITSTVTFATGEAGGTGFTPVYQMEEPYTVSGLGNKTYDTGYAPFTEQGPITIRISANITSFDDANAMTLMSASNPSAGVQFAGFNLYLSKNGMMTIYTSGNSTLVVPKNISTGEQLKWTNGAFDLFIVYNGDATLTVYVISNGAILEQRTITNAAFSSSRWNNWTLKLFSTGTSATQGAEGTVSVLKVYDTAFTEQDVLNNI